MKKNSHPYSLSKTRILARFSQAMRMKRYSPRTEKTYCYWIRFFIRFTGCAIPPAWGNLRPTLSWCTWRSSAISRRRRKPRH
ncbi:phage integrase N-terminal SAM-like domain-containing protein [Halomonas huangheensis]|uniref:phage integrase N-terminal SAM-like domain-containing protein n=1 Tax=Halomonas huangheensis TaxID=1178482 RepID=UPI003AAD7935